MRIPPFLRLMRPANIVTALADILAGAAVAGAWSVSGGSPEGLPWLLLSTIGLYGGGVVLNDVFDADLDRIERPERPIPSGKISIVTAGVGGFGLLIAGILAASRVSQSAALLALLVAGLAVGYDKFGKHHPVIGPLMMGCCRGGNLLLGMSIVWGTVSNYWFLALVPILFIADITLTSQGEVSGKNKPTLRLALTLDAVVVGLFVLISFLTPYTLLTGLPFLALWWWMNTSAKLRALRDNEPALIMRAVKAGVLSLIPLNAALTAGFLGWREGLLVLLLLPVSYGLGRFFAVT